MDISDTKAKELSQIAPPESIQRIGLFLEWLNRDQVQIPQSVGQSAFDFSEKTMAAIAPLAVRLASEGHQLRLVDLEGFVIWLFAWNRRLTEMEVIQRPFSFETAELPHYPLEKKRSLETRQSESRASNISEETRAASGKNETPEPIATHTAKPPSPASDLQSPTRVGTPSQLDEAKVPRFLQYRESLPPRLEPPIPTGPPLADRVLKQLTNGVWTANSHLGFAFAGTLLGQNRNLGETATPVAANPQARLLPEAHPQPSNSFGPAPNVRVESLDESPAEVPSSPKPASKARTLRVKPDDRVAGQQHELGEGISRRGRRVKLFTGEEIEPVSQQIGFQQNLLSRIAMLPSFLQSRIFGAGSLLGLGSAFSTASVPGSGRVADAQTITVIGDTQSEPSDGKSMMDSDPSLAIGNRTQASRRTRGTGVLARQQWNLPAHAASAAQLASSAKALGPVTGMFSDPLQGQITLIAPPLQVASHQSAEGGSAVQVDWRTLAKGIGSLQLSDITMLSQALPAGAQALYPALPPGAGGPNAMNLSLAPSALEYLIETGYGPGAAAGSRAIPTTSSSAPVGSLDATIVPFRTPTVKRGSAMGGSDEEASASFAQAGSAQSKRGGALDFVGLPVRFAPKLGSRSDLADQIAVRSGATSTPGGAPISPEVFKPFLSKVAPAFQSVHAEPDLAKWQKAAPQFGMNLNSPTDVILPDARRKINSPSESLAQADSPAPHRAAHSSHLQSPSVPDSTGIDPDAPRLSRLGLRPNIAFGSNPSVTGAGSLNARRSLGRSNAIDSDPAGAFEAPNTFGRIQGNPLRTGGNSAQQDQTSDLPRTSSNTSPLMSIGTQHDGGLPPIGLKPMRIPHSPRFPSSSTMPQTVARGFNEQESDANQTEYHPEQVLEDEPSRFSHSTSTSSGRPRHNRTPEEHPSSPRILPFQAPIPPPSMLYRAAHSTPASGAMRIQTSKGGSRTPAMASAVEQKPSAAHQKDSQKEKNKGADVRMMAQEVWSILKGRISAERDRMGLR